MDNWSKVEDLFHAALAQPPEQRSKFLREACPEDRQLRGEVQALLDRAVTDTFLQGSPLSSVEAPAPALSPGQMVGAFEVLELIGRGGMGEVYKARDTRLGRLVALKRSHGPFSARFEREAQAIARFNHPNICTLYDVGPDYLVIEFIEGEALGRRIGAKPLPAGQAIEIAVQIADALVAAHAKGIIHRDIKPANIFVTDSKTGGHLQVKVLDFGLAKLAEEAASELTCPGSAIGTIAYMSPEQARGEDLDARSDLFSFGVLLYEMCTGKLPFQGATSALVFEAILNREPKPPVQLNPEIPAEIERIIQKLLEKDRNLRYQGAADVLADLRRLKRDQDSGQSAVVATAARRRQRWLYLAAGCLLVVLLAAVAALFRIEKKTVGAPAQWEQLTNFPDAADFPTLSADGRLLAFVRNNQQRTNQLYIKLLPGGQPVALARGVNNLGWFPAFSPDGSRIAYTNGDGWNTVEVPVTGGEPRLLLANATGLNWIDNQRLLFSEFKTVRRLALITATESRTEARDVYIPSDEYGMAHFSALSPDRKQVLLGEMDRNGMLPCRLVPFDGSSMGRQVGPPGACSGVGWSPDGKWMYLSAEGASGGSHIWRQRPEGGNVEQLTFGPTTEQGVAVAPDGKSLITSVGTTQLSVWVHNSKGEEQILSESGGSSPVFSPDGRQVYYTARQRQGLRSSGEVWVADLATGRTERALPGVETVQKSLSPDGRMIAYSTPDGGIWIAPLDRRTPPRKLASGATSFVQIGSSGDVFFIGDEARFNYLYRVRQDGSGRRRVLDISTLQFLSISPDEQWVSVRSTDSDMRARHVKAYPLGGGQPVTLCRCGFFTWAPDGGSVWIQYRRGMAPAMTAAVPLKRGAMLPPFPPDGIQDMEELASIPGVRIMPHARVAFGPGLSTWVWDSPSSQRNLYRIPIE